MGRFHGKVEKLMYLEMEYFLIDMKVDVTLQNDQLGIGRGGVFGKNGTFCERDAQDFVGIGLCQFLHLKLSVGLFLELVTDLVHSISFVKELRVVVLR
jgi:hypothetical protein